LKALKKKKIKWTISYPFLCSSKDFLINQQHLIKWIYF